MPTLILVVGLPGAGKTTTATLLAAEHHALRLTPDEWMIPLFGESNPGGKRDVLEGRLITVALQVLRLGIDVVLDFGCWSRDERSAIRSLTEQADGEFRMHYLPIERDTQIERIGLRWELEPHNTFPMTVADVDRWRLVFEVPDADEIAGNGVDPAPAGWTSWTDWARDRWPSLQV